MRVSACLGLFCSMSHTELNPTVSCKPQQPRCLFSWWNSGVLQCRSLALSIKHLQILCSKRLSCRASATQTITQQTIMGQTGSTQSLDFQGHLWFKSTGWKCLSQISSSLAKRVLHFIHLSQTALHNPAAKQVWGWKHCLFPLFS